MLNRAIESGKEYRKPYRKSKAVDKSCRNHGGCPWCERNRLAKHKASEDIANQQIREHRD